MKLRLRRRTRLYCFELPADKLAEWLQQQQIKAGFNLASSAPRQDIALSNQRKSEVMSAAQHSGLASGNSQGIASKFPKGGDSLKSPMSGAWQLVGHSDGGVPESNDSTKRAVNDT